jgi:hypothetical protein
VLKRGSPESKEDKLAEAGQPLKEKRKLNDRMIVMVMVTAGKGGNNSNLRIGELPGPATRQRKGKVASTEGINDVFGNLPVLSTLDGCYRPNMKGTLG